MKQQNEHMERARSLAMINTRLYFVRTARRERSSDYRVLTVQRGEIVDITNTLNCVLNGPGAMHRGYIRVRGIGFNRDAHLRDTILHALYGDAGELTYTTL